MTDAIDLQELSELNELIGEMVEQAAEYPGVALMQESLERRRTVLPVLARVLGELQSSLSAIAQGLADTSPARERRLFGLRLEIESEMFETLDNGFTVDELEEFVMSVIEQIREDADEPV